ncbi:hypothetical protein LAZ67_5002474 [Cordylochernes scorpioides]|uniref:DUF7041 domain-containing protein n=1 Tax=Cordylochernes scorpioides TaxID=51811 RepID=A0ABY6KHJ6_9ARAC|nr:hypothetical protein LAZ67_5002474 [Cordylochernes scorpioides]
MDTEKKPSDTLEKCKVSVKIPPFWVEKPEIWFFQVEAHFKIGGIIQEDTKFNYFISQLEPKYIENIWDIINSKSDNKYSECKSRLLELFRESEGLRIKKLISGIELGDMKPSQLLQKLISLATPDISDNLIKTLWLDKLPTSIKNIYGWIKGERHMPFAVQMIWREPKDHSSDCYFCLTKTTGITSKSRHTVEYPDLPSAMRPVPHSDILPVPQPPENVIFSDDDSDRREQ